MATFAFLGFFTFIDDCLFAYIFFIDIFFLFFIIYAGLHDRNATSGQLLAIFYFQVQISVVLQVIFMTT